MQLLFDSILPTAELLSKLESVLSKAAAALSTKFISYSLFNKDKSHFLLLIFSFLKTLFIYLALVVLGLRCCGGHSSCGLSHSHCGGFSCCRARALGYVGLNNCGTWAQWLWLLGSRAQAK